jgi:hypothetical protein
MGWYPDGTGVLPGRPGEDAAEGSESYSIRLRHRVLLDAVVIRTAYVVENDERPYGWFHVMVRTEHIVCTDRDRPAETEAGRHADDYNEDWDENWPTAAAAGEHARKQVISEILENACCLDWDGETS